MTDLRWCVGEPIQRSFPFGFAQGQDDESRGGSGIFLKTSNGKNVERTLWFPDLQVRENGTTRRGG